MLKGPNGQKCHADTVGNAVLVARIGKQAMRMTAFTHPKKHISGLAGSKVLAGTSESRKTLRR